MQFSPIAIVGRACVLPGALSPEQLWEVVSEGQDRVGPAPPDRWRVPKSDILCAPGQDPVDRAWSDHGGYVQDFERVWDPSGFAMPESELSGLDPHFLWTLHCARQALRDAGDDRTGRVNRTRVGAIFGNLGFPTSGMSLHAEALWCDQPEQADPRNRFMFGGASRLLQRALGLSPFGLCVDTACASSLYAIKLACDQLHDGRVDLALAGAVNRSDDLFIHVGFTALQAMSRTGRSRPFCADADGLVPAEGAGFVALKRLSDARRDGDLIHGIIRSIGLSNDGRGRGFLAPCEQGQLRALRQAYELAGLKPKDVSLLECHATGTSVGDAAELRSASALFEGCRDVPIGSLKSNLGHLITAAGVAALIKVLEALRHGQRPPTLHVATPNAALEGSPFRLLSRCERWECEGVRTAGVSAFGFGGNNAHLLVSEPTFRETRTLPRPAPSTSLAIVGMGTVVGPAEDRPAFARALLSGASLIDGEEGARTPSIDLDLTGLRFPPKDLKNTLPQQLAALKAAAEAMAQVEKLDRPHTGVFMSIEPDVEVCRYGLRWRLSEVLRKDGSNPAEHGDWLRHARDEIIPALSSAGVIGTMPNIPANRLNSQFDLGGASVTVSGGERSGLRCLDLAHRALATGELNAALVCGVDLSCHPVHGKALAALEGFASIPGDAAVALVVKRLADAEQDGDRVLGVLEVEPTSSQEEDPPLDDRLGRCWAAGDLRDLAAKVVCESHRTDLYGRPRFGTAFGTSIQRGPHDRITLRPGAFPPPPQRIPTLHMVAAADAAGVLSALDAGREGGDGPCRLVILADGEEQYAERVRRARRHIATGTPTGPGVHYRVSPIGGEVGFVFGAAGSAYEGMGRPLLHAFPDLGEALFAKSAKLTAAYAEPWDSEESVRPLQRLWAASALCQLHAILTQERLGLRPDALIGYSSGETNALFAAGIWTDLDAMIEQSAESGLFTEMIGGKMTAVRRCWGKPAAWETWTVLAPVGDVRMAVEAEDHVHLSVVHGVSDCIIAGAPDGCARIVELVGRSRCLRLHYDLAVHVPELDEVREHWLALHRRKVTPRPGARVYSSASASAYVPSSERCAQAILEQAVRTLDFPRVVESAWNDGVRVFIEHGPQANCGRWIRGILGDRDALVVSLDRKGAGLEHLLESVAALWAAGVAFDPSRWLERIVTPRSRTRPTLRFDMHRPPVRMPPLPNQVPRREPSPRAMPPAPDLAPRAMPPAPELPPILSEGSLAHAVLPPTAERPTPVAIPQSMSSNPWMDTYRRQVGELGNVQQSFIAQQAALHQRFLAMQRQAMHSLLQAGAGLGTALPNASLPQPRRVELRREVPAEASIVRPRALREPVGPSFDRAQLEVHASGRISEIFGDKFTIQDDYTRQVRMPEPPLLLADRVTGIDAIPGTLGLGTIWSETDITEDAWYLHQGHIPAGIMIESGQADLMLISWMGVDFTNRGERVYRLLGCELVYHGGLAAAGDTLRYDIHMDGHASQGAVRLMFFHYDCRVDGRIRLSVRNGQAGFFTDGELANSDGCLWKPEQQEIVENPRLDAPHVVCTRTSLIEEQVRAFSEGRPWDCFGSGFELAKTHTRTPRIQHGRMMLLGPVDCLEVRGGPWKRGYLRSSVDIDPSIWFFNGHFKNDPCMPGTLMFEGCLQAMALYLAGLGYTLERDGWRFEPVSDVPFALSCRGQVTPGSRRLTYEVFVEEVHDGPEPTLWADLLCTVDGLKAFHARRVGLKLVAAWPLDEGHPLLEGHVEPEAVARAGDFSFDFRSMLACANGRPSEAFGPAYARFDGPRRVARLPNSPYHFLSRVTRVTDELGAMRPGVEADVLYDIPSDGWYFDENGCRTMPFAVLLEAVLQPCGWLASYMGCALSVDEELAFRNLDGHGQLLVDVLPSSGTLVTRVRNTGISKTASMIIVSFDVTCLLDDEPIYEMQTVFGFFPKAAFENQVGLPTTDAQRALFDAPSTLIVDLTTCDGEYWRAERPRLPEPMLLMLDRITQFDPKGGEAGLGTVRGEKDVDPGAWFFKAHFFQDPVQPGSLGIEAMIQLLQWYMLETGMDAGIEQPRFEPIALGETLTWKYRGQVVPTNKLITTTLELTGASRDERGVTAVARASLWVDGKRIYEAEGLAMRIVSGGVEQRPLVTLDPDEDAWLRDHCPTWTVPALPMTSMVDLLAQGACRAEPVSAIRDVRVKGWLCFDRPHTLRTRRSGNHMRLLDVNLDGTETEVASATVITGPYAPRPEPIPSLDGIPAELPYETGRLMHGPAFQAMLSLVRDERGASSVLEAKGTVPIGRLNPRLLDAAMHGIPHDDLRLWDSRFSSDKVAYPALISEMNFYGPTPTSGPVRCEVRPDGFLGTADYPAFRVQLIGDAGVWCCFRLVEACFPKGPLGRAEPMVRRQFLRDRVCVPGLRLSREVDGSTRLRESDVVQVDWLPGTVASLYGSRSLEEVARKEHIASAHGLHPGRVPAALPLTRFELDVKRDQDELIVTGDPWGALDTTRVRAHWRQFFGLGPWPVEELYYGLIERFVRRVVVTDPEAFNSVLGRSVIFLGNHQVGIESLMFSVIASALCGVTTRTLAKVEHKETWLGRLIEHCFQYPGVKDPGVVAFFDRTDPGSLPKILQDLTEQGTSLMVHVEGTRATSCRAPVTKMSGALVDLAIRVGAPIVPVRFVGGLPVEPLSTRLEYPVGMGRQDIFLGAPLAPETLAAMHYGERIGHVLASINGLGPSHTQEVPGASAPGFAERVREWQQRCGVTEPYAVLGCVLAALESPGDETRQLLSAGCAKELEGTPTGDWLAVLGRWMFGR